MGSKINGVYERLCLLSVFRKLLSSPLFERFFAFAKAPSPSERLLAYGDFVNEIYNGGESLTECVRKLVFEDENVYIKAAAKKQAVPANIENSAKLDLHALSLFASLTKGDFEIECKTDITLPAFDSEAVDLAAEYKDRLPYVSKLGFGIYASHGMFRLSDDSGEIEPIKTPDGITVSHFVGYERERESLIANTKAFLHGKPSANVLLYGDAGTGKSSSVKAVANLLFDEGIRLLELRKDQLYRLPYVMGKIAESPLKFIVFIDDLSFALCDDSFSTLKAALEGSASAKAENALIYATSNRRHIVRETFGERAEDEVHRNDSMQELLSLSERFGLKIRFGSPDKKLYISIVEELARRENIDISAEELSIKAEAFALSRGTRSARCAEQFVKSLTV